MKKIFFILIFVTGLISLKKSFSQNVDYFDTTNYTVKLNKYLSPTYNKHPEVKEEVEKLTASWDSIGDLHFGITYVSNSMFYKRVKPYPDFYNYISTLNTLLEKNNMDYYREWEVGLLALLETDPKDFRLKTVQNFLSFSHQLIRDSVLYKNSTVTWKIKTTNYEIGNDIDSGIYVFFAKPINLYCYSTSNVDSFVIKNVRGTCYPVNHKFHGEEGRITWERYGFPEDKVFAKFNEFHVEMAKGEIEFPEAVYTNEYYKLTQIPGKLKVKIVMGKSQNVSPQFYSKDIVTIKNPVPGTTISGKVLVKGKSFAVTGGNKQLATLFITYKDQMYYTRTRAKILASNIKIIKDSVLSSNSAKFTFYINGNQDSLYHPNSAFTYQKGLTHRKKIKIQDKKTKQWKEKWTKESIFKKQWFDSTKIDVLNDTSFFLTISSKPKNTLGVYDSYHKMEIFIDKMLWKKADTLVYFLITQSGSYDYLKINSDYYFDEKLFQKYTEPGLVYLNHLQEIASFYDDLEKDNTPLTTDLYSQHLATVYNRKYTNTQVTSIFEKLYNDGFLEFNIKTGIAKPTPKLYRYVDNEKRLTYEENARNKKLHPELKKTSFTDFDRLSIISQKGRSTIRPENVGINAILNLNTNILDVKYVKPIKLAPTVIIKTPEIKIIADRNFEFNGVVRAGGLVFYDHESANNNDTTATNSKNKTNTKPHFKYNYAQNKIEITQPAFMRMQYLETDSATGKITGIKTLTTEVKDIKGDIVIDKPDNKSLVDREEKYPLFVSKQKAQINFSLPEEYKSDFSFSFDNFNKENLDFLTEDSLKFGGILTTNLLDPMHITVSVRQGRKGYFLGFNECFGEDHDKKSLYLREKDATLIGCIELNDDGLYANGTIYYKAATIYGHSMQLLPNNITGTIDSITIDDKTGKENIPYIAAKSLEMEWPKDIHLTLPTTSKVQIYNFGKDYIGLLHVSSKDTSGFINYTEGKCYAHGDFEFKDATIIADTINLFSKKFDTKKCDFTLKNKGTTAFNTKNLNGVVDMTDKQGFFRSNDDTSSIYFEKIQYVCIMDHFLWKIGEGIVDIGGTMNGEDTTHYAQSIEEKKHLKEKGKNLLLYGTILESMEDGLSFNAKATQYTYGDAQFLTAKQVHEIYVSDAKIEPSTDVKITVGGKILPLKNATVGFPYPIDNDTITYNYKHIFNHANVKIEGKYSYTADSAIYTYPYNNQLILFKIKSEETGEKVKYKKKSFDKCKSIANCNYHFSDHYYLNKYFITSGKGQITLQADKRNPIFSGYAKIDTLSQLCNNSFKVIDFKYNSTSIDPNKVLLPINMINESRHGEIFNGIVWEQHLKRGRGVAKHKYFIKDYFIQPSPTDSTKRIFSGGGEIYYNEISSSYRISTDTNFLFNDILDQGQYFAFDKDNCQVFAQGDFDLFNHFDIKKPEFNAYISGTYTHRLDTTPVFEGLLTINMTIPDEIIKDLAYNCIRVYDSLPVNSLDKKWTSKYMNIAIGKEETDLYREAQELPERFKNATFVFNDVRLRPSPNGDTIKSVNKNDKIELVAINGRYIDTKIKTKIVYVMSDRSPYFILIMQPFPDYTMAFRYVTDKNDQYLNTYINTPNTKLNNYLTDNPKKGKMGKNYTVIDKDKNKFEDNYHGFIKFIGQ